MNRTITRNEYMQILKEEKELLGSTSYEANIQSTPSDYAVNNILNFSKAYSCKSSRTVGTIEHVLN